MSTLYLGKLNSADPLYEILMTQVCPDIRDPLFHVNKMNSGKVYKYTEEKSRVAIIGKFFRMDDTRQERVLRIKGEYDNLRKIRNYGFDVPPNYVVRPISREEKIGLALIEEFIQGRDLDYYFKKAIYEGNSEILKKRLAELAFFLFALHTRTATEHNIDLASLNAYYQKIVNTLYKQSVISDQVRQEALKFMDKWLKRSIIQSARNVVLHGDATPTNFIFDGKGDVVAIDLERMKNGDMAYDIGMVCGEIKHAFLWRTGDPFRSEMFIRHFLKSYTAHFKDSRRSFREITLRNPFYMALTELRIARNNYLDWNYRKRLAHEAMECLKWGLKLE